MSLYSEPLFFRNEFACRCGCGFDTVDAELLQVLLKAREDLNAPVDITSGCRCSHHNARVNGSPKSMHLLGRAGDINIRTYTPAQVHEYLCRIYPDKYGIGKYQSFTHIDTRSGPPATW